MTKCSDSVAAQPRRSFVIGIVGRSGSGKTTLLTKLIPELTRRGVSVSTVKHTHHDFDMDQPGKDSYRHREAGATEVVLASAYRWALLHELRGASEPDMEELIGHMSPVDIVLVEGFKHHPYPKIEVHRPSLGHPLMAHADASVVAVAADERMDGVAVPVLELGDPKPLADLIVGMLRRNAE